VGILARELEARGDEGCCDHTSKVRYNAPHLLCNSVTEVTQLIKVDLHVHTVYSDDCLTPLRDVLRWVVRRQLGAVAITDHNTIAGALAFASMSHVPVIVGEEILTTGGEIIGLFLCEEIPAYLPPAETARRIHQQGGLVYIPHPFDRIRHSALQPDALAQVIERADVLEVHNGRVTFVLDNRRADDLARARHLLRGAGSDAHQGFEIGRSYVEMPAFADMADFVSGLRQGEIGGHVSSPLVHMSSTYARLAKGILAVGLTGQQ
jgi:predicted metal-dependent phosphoesterase TrpH